MKRAPFATSDISLRLSNVSENSLIWLEIPISRLTLSVYQCEPRSFFHVEPWYVYHQYKYKWIECWFHLVFRDVISNWNEIFYSDIFTQSLSTNFEWPNYSARSLKSGPGSVLFDLKGKNSRFGSSTVRNTFSLVVFNRKRDTEEKKEFRRSLWNYWAQWCK